MPTGRPSSAGTSNDSIERTNRISSDPSAAGHANRKVIRRAICGTEDRKSTRLNSSHLGISYAVFCLKKKKNAQDPVRPRDGTGLARATHEIGSRRSRLQLDVPDDRHELLRRKHVPPRAHHTE